MALALGEDRDEHVGAGHLLPARGLDVNNGALDHPLESGGGLCILAPVADQIVELLIDIIAQILSQQLEIDRASPQDRRRVGIFGEAQQKVFESRIFVMALIGDGKGAVKSLFEIA